MCLLVLGTVCMLVWLVLGLFWNGVSKVCKGTFHIVRHGQVYLAVLVVLVHGDSQIPFSFPILFHFVVLLDCLDKVHDVLFSTVLDAKIIHD